MTKNIVDFPGMVDEAPQEPDHFVYEMKIMMPDGSVETVQVEGYLVVTGAFIGICHGPYGKSEFKFIAPMERAIYSNCLGPVKYTGKLQS